MAWHVVVSWRATSYRHKPLGGFVAERRTHLKDVFFVCCQTIKAINVCFVLVVVAVVVFLERFTR